MSLSPTEFTLLRYFMVNAGTVLSKPRILDHVWRYDFGGEVGVVETYVSYLRRKVDTGETAADPHAAWRRLCHACSRGGDAHGCAASRCA